MKLNIKNHLKDNAVRYYLILFASIVGLALGIYFAISGFSYSSLLTNADKNMFAYISGTASYSSIFWSRLTSLLICVLLIFVFNLVRETAFLNYIYLAYQFCLIVLSSSAIITMYGLSGILNVIFFMLPINLINYGLICFMAVISEQRSALAKQYRLSFVSSFKEVSYFKKFLIALLIVFVFCLIYSFVYPLVFKSIVVINY